MSPAATLVFMSAESVRFTFGCFIFFTYCVTSLIPDKETGAAQPETFIDPWDAFIHMLTYFMCFLVGVVFICQKRE